MFTRAQLARAALVTCVGGGLALAAVVAAHGTGGDAGATPLVMNTQVSGSAGASTGPDHEAAKAVSAVTPNAVSSRGTLQLQVGGVGGVPNNAAAVVMNVTVVNAAAPGYVTVWPCGQPQPNTSNLNYVRGQTVPNLTITKLGTGGKVCFLSLATVELIADVAGYYPAGSDYTALSPARILDTRLQLGGTRVGAGGILQLQVGGRGGVPTNAAGAVMNVTATNPAGPGYVTVWPCGQALPNTSNLNFSTGQTVPNLTITKLGAGGRICIRGSVATDLIADVSGYYPAGSSYTTTGPTRILDTRVHLGGSRLAAQSTLQLQVGGAGGVPATASAVVMNVTVTNPAANGYVTVWPCGQARPNASNLNYVRGQTVPNLTITKLGAGGRVCLYSLGASDVIADVSGYDPAGSSYKALNPTRILDTRNGTGVPTPSSSCRFSKADVPTTVAFCEDFSVAHPTPATTARTGDLDPTLWGVSRTGTAVNAGQGQYNNFFQATLVGCGAAQTVTPPRDVRVCSGRLQDAINDGEGQTTLAMYPKQPFDFANRTGTVVFDVSADSDGPHAAWPEFWITDQPVPAPKGELTTQFPYARNSFGFMVAADFCPAGQTSVYQMMATRNYAFALIPFTSTGCVTKGSPTGGLNHFEVRVSQTRVEVWASDAGSSAVKQIAVAASPNLSFTRGVVWIEDIHYNADKFSNQRNHDFGWDNVGFDGPAPYRDLTFDVPDANVAAGGGAVRLGYPLSSSPLNVSVQGVHWLQTPTTALVLFNWWAQVTSVPTVRVNGGPPHTLVWPFDPTTFGWRTIAIPVPFSEVHSGTNTLSFTSSDSTAISNINVGLIAASPVP